MSATRVFESTSRSATAPVVVVGARCAGAATAMLLARQGHDVIVIDRTSLPSDTLSTHAIVHGGVVQLGRWGLLDRVVASGAPPIRRVFYHLGDGTRLRLAYRDRTAVEFLVAPRRHVLDTMLLSAAVEAGARFVSGVTATAVRRDPSGRVVGVLVRDGDGREHELAASFVVGADGFHSRIARAVGATTISEYPSDTATYYVYAAGLAQDCFEIHIGPGGIAGVVPTNGGEANVWVWTPAEAAELAFSAAIDRFGAYMALLESIAPTLADRLRTSRVSTPVRGIMRLPNHVRQAAGSGWALVGDAGYHRDPISSHGISDAFRDAEVLADGLGAVLRDEATEHEALASYAAARDEALAPVLDVTRRLAAFPPADRMLALHFELGGYMVAEGERLAADAWRLPLALSRTLRP